MDPGKQVEATIFSVVHESFLPHTAASTSFCIERAKDLPVEEVATTTFRCDDQTCVHQPRSPKWFEKCSESMSWLDSFDNAAHANTTNSSWVVPSLQTLRDRDDLLGVGYTEFSLASSAPIDIDATAYFFDISVNGRPALIDGMPLARQEKMFARLGIDLPRSTMASWLMRCSELVSPLLDRILEEIRNSSYVLADETTFQVLKEEGKAAQSKSYLWALRREDPDHPLLYYAYDPSRCGEVARRLLNGFQGFLQADGYSGYDGFEQMEGVVLVGCFAHARRKFDEAMRGQGKPKKGRQKSDKKRIVDQGLAKINALFKIERGYRGASLEERHRLREEKLRPKLVELRAWTLEVKDRVPPKSLTGKALTYLDNQWHKLFRVLDDGRIELSTNAVERAIRPFVIGRKGWLFADTPRGATVSARLYSLVETAKANGIEPFAYLKQVFTLLAATEEPNDIAELLPWRITLPDR
jgi:hypothetical protein